MLMGRLDSPGSAGNSPSRTEYAGTGVVAPQTVSQPDSALGTPQVTVPQHGDSLRPPDPAVGGVTAPSNVLGWTTGLRLSRAYRQRFTGATLVVPSTDVATVVGPVGFKLGRPSAGRVNALTSDHAVDNVTVAGALGSGFGGQLDPGTSTRSAVMAMPGFGKSFNPLLREMR